MSNIIQIILISILIIQIYSQIYPIPISIQSQYIKKSAQTVLDDKAYKFQDTFIGRIPYGKTIKGEAVVSDNLDGCTIQKKKATKNNKSILLVGSSRKNCNWTLKAKNASDSGSKLLIIVEDEQADKYAHKKENLEKIGIPVISVSNEDGQKLMKAVKYEPTLKLAVYFDHPPQRKKVQVDYWMNVVDQRHYPFIFNFKKFYLQNKDKITFSPRIPLRVDHEAQRKGFKESVTGCFSGGKYCFTPYAPSLKTDFDAQVGIEYNLKMYCIFKQNELVWFNLLENLHDYCIYQDPQYKRAKVDLNSCFEEVISKFGQSVDQEHLKECYNNDKKEGSYKIQIEDHDILKREYQYQLNQQVSHTPSLLVNDLKIDGNIQEEYDIFPGICSGFDKEHFPKMCELILGYTPKEFDIDLIQYDGRLEEKQEHIMTCLLIGGLCFFIFVYFFRRYENKRIQNTLDAKVNSSVAKFLATQQQL